jgi:hypothetical protein
MWLQGGPKPLFEPPKAFWILAKATQSLERVATEQAMMHCVKVARVFYAWDFSPELRPDQAVSPRLRKPELCPLRLGLTQTVLDRSHPWSRPSQPPDGADAFNLRVSADGDWQRYRWILLPPIESKTLCFVVLACMSGRSLSFSPLAFSAEKPETEGLGFGCGLRPRLNLAPPSVSADGGAF